MMFCVLVKFSIFDQMIVCNILFQQKISFIIYAIMNLCCMVDKRRSVTILGISLLSIILLSSSGFAFEDAFAATVPIESKTSLFA